MTFFDFTGAARLRKAAVRLLLPWFGLLAQAHAADINLNAGWQFYRADDRQIASADQVPAGAWTRVDLPHAARLEPRVPTAPGRARRSTRSGST